MLCNEDLVGLAEAAAILPKTSGKKVSTSSLWRWITEGREGVRLEALRIGGRYYTSRESLHRFGAALTAKAVEAVSNRPAISATRQTHIKPSTQAKRLARANAVLDAAGIV